MMEDVGCGMADVGWRNDDLQFRISDFGIWDLGLGNWDLNSIKKIKHYDINISFGKQTSNIIAVYEEEDHAAVAFAFSWTAAGIITL